MPFPNLFRSRVRIACRIWFDFRSALFGLLSMPLRRVFPGYHLWFLRICFALRPVLGHALAPFVPPTCMLCNVLF
jgi:hypothetical protein